MGTQEDNILENSRKQKQKGRKGCMKQMTWMKQRGVELDKKGKEKKFYKATAVTQNTIEKRLKQWIMTIITINEDKIVRKRHRPAGRQKGQKQKEQWTGNLPLIHGWVKRKDLGVGKRGDL